MLVICNTCGTCYDSDVGHCPHCSDIYYTPITSVTPFYLSFSMCVLSAIFPIYGWLLVCSLVTAKENDSARKLARFILISNILLTIFIAMICYICYDYLHLF
jgi:hypothetical protein